MSNQNQVSLDDPTSQSPQLILCHWTLDSTEERFAILRKKKTTGERKMEETSGRATEQGSLCQDRQACDRSDKNYTIYTNI